MSKRVRRTKAEIAAGVTLEQAKANREAEVKQEVITEPVPPVEDVENEIIDEEIYDDPSPIGLDEEFEFEDGEEE